MVARKIKNTRQKTMDATLYVASMLQFLRNYKIFFTFLYEQIKTLIVLVLNVIINGIACTYFSQLIRFARVCSQVEDFNARNKCLTAELLKQGYWCHKLRKAFPSSKFNVDLKSLIHQGLSEPEFYGDSIHIQKDYG